MAPLGCEADSALGALPRRKDCPCRCGWTALKACPGDCRRIRGRLRSKLREPLGNQLQLVDQLELSSAWRCSSQLGVAAHAVALAARRLRLRIGRARRDSVALSSSLFP